MRKRMVLEKSLGAGVTVPVSVRKVKQNAHQIEKSSNISNRIRKSRMRQLPPVKPVVTVEAKRNGHVSSNKSLASFARSARSRPLLFDSGNPPRTVQSNTLFSPVFQQQQDQASTFTCKINVEEEKENHPHSLAAIASIAEQRKAEDSIFAPISLGECSQHLNIG